jgi:2-C-methyl-D-erythritol 4-phosphate cytidylyltransferase
MTHESLSAAHNRHRARHLASESAGAVVLAAGQGLRFGRGIKPLASLAETPILAWTLTSVAANRCVHHIVVTAPANALDSFRNLVADLDLHLPVQVIEGGATRQCSAKKGLEALPGGSAWVAVTDAARPLQRPGLIDSLVRQLASHEPKIGPRGETIVGILPALPLTDTVHHVTEDSFWARTPDRHRLRAAQTPQVACRPCLLAAHHEARRANVELTDDAAVLGWAGAGVLLIPGDPANVKITIPGDLLIAEAYLAEKRQSGRRTVSMS